VFRFTNAGNNDIEYLQVLLEMPATTRIGVVTDGRLRTRSVMAADSVLQEGESVTNFSTTGEVTGVPLLARDIAPGETVETQLTVWAVRTASSDFPVRVNWRIMDSDAFLELYLTQLELARQTALETPDLTDPVLRAGLEDPEEFASEAIQSLVALGVINPDMVPEAESVYETIESSVRERLLAAALGLSSCDPSLMKSASLSCDDFFTATGCAIAIVGCLSTPINPIVGTVLCTLGIMGCATSIAGVPLEEGGIVGCVGVASALNCVGQELLCNTIARSKDPNDILGPEGYGDARWVSAGRPLGYTIRFENDPKLATAPAQRVRVTHPLDEDLDERTFRLGSFGFAGMTFTVPANRAVHSQRLDLSDSLGIYVDFTAGIDVTSRTAFWDLVSVDPATGQLPSHPYTGFLAVNDSLGSGEGFVTFSVRPRAGTETGDEVVALASIVFDRNEAIETPAIRNTLDASPPESRIVVADPQAAGEWLLQWSAQDDGSGVRDYSLYVADDDGEFKPYQLSVESTSLSFLTEEDRSYRFFVVASDNTGNLESLKTSGEVKVAVDPSSDVPASFALHQAYPNPFNPSASIPFDLPREGSVQMNVFDTLGRLVRTYNLGDLPAGRYEHVVRMADVASGVYLYEIRVASGTGLLHRAVGKMVLLK
jgi:hypothetical protein